MVATEALERVAQPLSRQYGEAVSIKVHFVPDETLYELDPRRLARFFHGFNERRDGSALERKAVIRFVSHLAICRVRYR